MPAAGARADASSSAVADVVRRTRARAAVLGAEVWRRVVEYVPGADGWDEALRETGPLSAEENLRGVAAVLDPQVAGAATTAPVVALAHARQFARSGVALASLLTVYQIGHEVWLVFYYEVLE